MWRALSLPVLGGNYVMPVFAAGTSVLVFFVARSRGLSAFSRMELILLAINFVAIIYSGVVGATVGMRLVSVFGGRR